MKLYSDILYMAVTDPFLQWLARPSRACWMSVDEPLELGLERDVVADDGPDLDGAAVRAPADERPGPAVREEEDEGRCPATRRIAPSQTRIEPGSLATIRPGELALARKVNVEAGDLGGLALRHDLRWRWRRPRSAVL